MSLGGGVRSPFKAGGSLFRLLRADEARFRVEPRTVATLTTAIRPAGASKTAVGRLWADFASTKAGGGAQMATTFLDVVFSLIQRNYGAWERLEALRRAREMAPGNRLAWRVGILIHSPDDAFLLLPLHPETALGRLMQDIADAVSRAGRGATAYDLTLDDVLRHAGEVQMGLKDDFVTGALTMSIEAAAYDGDFVLYLGALILVGGHTCGDRNFRVFEVVQPPPMTLSMSEASKAVSNAPTQHTQESFLSLPADSREPFVLVVLKGPFVSRGNSVETAVEWLGGVVDALSPTTLVLLGPLANELHPGMADGKRALQAFLASLGALVARSERLRRCLVASHPDCALASDCFYPSLPYTPEAGLGAAGVELVGLPFSFVCGGLRFAVFETSHESFQFIESRSLKGAATDARPKASPNGTPSAPRRPDGPNSPFKRLEASRMASEDPQTVPQPPVLPTIGQTGKRAAPEAAGVAGTTETIEAAETTETDVTKEPERGRGGIRAPPVAVEGSFLRELKETALYGAVQDESCALLTGLERLRFQYFTHFCLSLGTAVPEFPSVRPLLFTRFRLTRVDEDADVVIATGSLSAAPFACHLNGRRRVLLGLEGAQGNLREKQALRLEAKEAREAEERGDKEEAWVTGELLALRVVNVG